LLCTTAAEAQVSPPLTPAMPCDGNAIRGARAVPALTLPTHSGSPSTELRQTSISISAKTARPTSSYLRPKCRLLGWGRLLPKHG
jgi:hypothetical protein